MMELKFIREPKSYENHVNKCRICCEKVELQRKRVEIFRARKIFDEITQTQVSEN
jgi:hypothetical protein